MKIEKIILYGGAALIGLSLLQKISRSSGSQESAAYAEPADPFKVFKTTYTFKGEEYPMATGSFGQPAIQMDRITMPISELSNITALNPPPVDTTGSGTGILPYETGYTDPQHDAYYYYAPWRTWYLWGTGPLPNLKRP